MEALDIDTAHTNCATAYDKACQANTGILHKQWADYRRVQLEQSTSGVGTPGPWDMAKEMITATLWPQSTRLEIDQEMQDLIRRTMFAEGQKMQPDLISGQELRQVMKSLRNIQAELGNQWNEYKRFGLRKAWRDSYKHSKEKTEPSNPTV
jgi:hypothetical protein